MVFIYYGTGCRKCLRTDGTRSLFPFVNLDQNVFKNKTEFEVTSIIEKWRYENKLTCEFCGSANVEILEVEVNNCRLYNFDRLVQRCIERKEYVLQVIVKQKDSTFNLETSGSPYFGESFLKTAILGIENTLEEKPDYYFNVRKNFFNFRKDGNFFICVTGGTSSLTGESYSRIETLSNAGLTKKEILNSIKEFAIKRGISIENKSNVQKRGDMNLEFDFKSSDHLSYENDKNVSGTHVGNMDKNFIFQSLEMLSNRIENKFNTVVLRKMILEKGSILFSTINPIDNSNLAGKENNIFGSTFPLLKSFDDNNVSCVCGVFIPTNIQGFVIDKSLQPSKETFSNLIDFCSDVLGLKVYDGGQIEMSYVMTNGIDNEIMFSTKDTPIVPDIYEKLGSIIYRRILYYF